MAEGHVCGQYTTHEWGESAFLHSEHPKNKKIINNNLSLLSGRKT